MHSFKTNGVCASCINFDVSEGVVRKVSFVNGCNGNTQGIAQLVEGMNAHDVVNKLKGIKCSGKATSCPDQLAKALEQHL